MQKLTRLGFGTAFLLSSLSIWAERPTYEQVSALSRIEGVSSHLVMFNTFHPQGMIKVGNDFFITSVDKKGKRALLFKCHLEDKKLVLSQTLELQRGEEYHPGGIDYDPKTKKLITAVAVYKRDSSAVVVRIDPETLKIEYGQKIQDHIGGVFVEKQGERIVGLNWDSLGSYLLENGDQLMPETLPRSPLLKGSDKGYQDIKALGGDGRWALASALRGNWPREGYLSLLTTQADGTVIEDKSISVPRVTNEFYYMSKGTGLALSPLAVVHKMLPLTQNPMDLELVRDSQDPTGNSDKIRFYFIPHDNESLLFIYEGVR